MAAFYSGLGVGFVLGGFVGMLVVALFASTRQAELRDALEEEKGRRQKLQQQLWQLQARCQKEFGAEWLRGPAEARA